MTIHQESFVLFRLPDQTDIKLWKLSDIQSESKFIFHSFDNTNHIELYAKEKHGLSFDDLKNLRLNIQFKSKQSLPHALSKQEYMVKANDFIEKLNQNSFDKIILSRVKIEDGIENLTAKFEDLCHKYPTAWVYLFHHQQETWLGASPERLLYATPTGYKTVALAGTKSKSEHRDWTEKEFQEHDYVVQYIVSKFNPNDIEKNGPYTIDLGEIQHLKTDIHISNKNLDLQQILNNLHPTPAVCGIPKDKAKEYIIENEGYDRSFYTGYFGIETPEHTEFNVNLRCAELFQNHIAIYVGGGLVAASNAESEWQETELKSKALL